MEKPLGNLLRDLREQKDVSLRQTAKEVGVSAVHLSDIEGGNRYPSDKLFESLANFFDISVDELKKCDSRPPVNEIKRLSSAHPSVGFAFRTVMEEIKEGRMTPEQLANRLKGDSQ